MDAHDQETQQQDSYLPPGIMEQWKDRNAPITADLPDINGVAIIKRRRTRLKKTSGKKSKRRDLQLT